MLILSINAGAGHIRAAAAIEEALKTQYPAVEVRNEETLQYTNAAFRNAFTKSYLKLAEDFPSVWGYIYGRMEAKVPQSKAKRIARIFDKLNSSRLRKMVLDYAPDRVVCTHYFAAEVLWTSRVKRKLKAPMFVTLTDYDIHVMWIQEGTDHYFVATDEMKYALEAKGVGGASVSVSGIPVMPIFSRRFPSRVAMRRRLGLDVDSPTVLTMAGGFGTGKLEEIVARLAETNPSAQFLCIAGRNERLKKALDAVAAEYAGRVVPYGFVTNVHELMAASDLAVTKSGGLTSSECMALGLPMVVVSPIPGQEERNSDHLLELGVAVRANSAAHLEYKVNRLLKNPAPLRRMRAAAASAARPRAAFDIAKRVVEWR